MINEFDPFSVCFNLLKLKYSVYDESLTSMNFLKPTDKVNVFINLETVWKNLSMITELEKKIIVQKDFHEIMISNILNLAAHYKRFFTSNGLDTKVYLYHTDLTSDEFNQFKYNEDYRAYYLVKFNDNPKFALFSEKLNYDIIPEVKTYCEFIPNVYYISAHNIEGSLVPYIISKEDPIRKNLIVGGELYDTQYSQISNFVNHYIHRTFNTNKIYSDLSGYLVDITKKETDEDGLTNAFSNYNLYCGLLAILGNKIRSIEGISGIGPITFKKSLTEAINKNDIPKEPSTPEIMSTIFHDGEIQEEFINNFYCSAIISMYDELTESEKSSVLSQLLDRSDKNTLEKINSTKFFNHPIILDSLL